MPTNTTEAPKNCEELKAYARDRMREIINKYNSDGQVFTDFPTKATGLIYRCGGAISLLLLVNGFDDLEHEEGWADIVKTEFDKVCAYIASKGFDASPLKQVNLFTAEGKYHYIDSVSWVLSFALHLRLAQVNNKLQLEGKHINSVKDLIKSCLEIIRDAACEDGGWGFTRGVSKPDLYYSYAVSESLADFGDYVLGESEDEIGIKKDEELITFLGSELIDKVQEKRNFTAQWLINEYLPMLGSAEVDPGLEKDIQKKPHILLYYSYFIIDMLIVDIPDSFFKDDFFQQAEQRINKGIEHALYLSRIDFDKARDDPSKWWDNYISSSLELSWEHFENPSLLGRMDPARTQIYEPGLVPLSLRCNALYAFYVAKGSDQKMASLFQILHDNRDPETGLWDSESYSLMVTERAIEAIVDYNDYLTKFEASQSTTNQLSRESNFQTAFPKIVNEAVRYYLQSADGVRLLSENLSVSVPSGPASLNDEQMLASLTSTLATISQYMMTGKELKSVRTDKIDRFRRTLNEFMMNMFHDWLKSGVKDKGKHKALREAAQENFDALSPTLGMQLASNPKIGEIPLLSLALYDLFNRVVSPQGQAQTLETKENGPHS